MGFFVIGHVGSLSILITADVNSTNLSYGHSFSQPGILTSTILDGIPK